MIIQIFQFSIFNTYVFVAGNTWKIIKKFVLEYFET